MLASPRPVPTPTVKPPRRVGAATGAGGASSARATPAKTTVPSTMAAPHEEIRLPSRQVAIEGSLIRRAGRPGKTAWRRGSTPPTLTRARERPSTEARSTVVVILLVVILLVVILLVVILL